MIVLEFLGIVILGYLIGAAPSGVIMSRLTHGIDVREYGSGSMGMTNVVRTIGAREGVLVLLADVVKGVAAVAFAWLIFDSSSATFAWGQVAGGCAAVVGHNWPAYIGFRGGRGVTTGFGALLVISWPVGLISLAIFVMVVTLSRYVSLGSILAAVTMLVVVVLFIALDVEPFASLLYALIIVPIVIFRHRGNIQRLLTGTEPKITRRANL
ncbi:glycerol-3-phosphate 1-O-acyltransferase PlsY [Chloroflexota bacterium]